MKSSRITAFFAATAISVCLLHAQPAIKVTTPKEALGFNLGEIKSAQNRPERTARVQQARAERPDRAEKPDRVERMDRPMRPERPERPQK